MPMAITGYARGLHICTNVSEGVFSVVVNNLQDLFSVSKVALVPHVFVIIKRQ